MMTARGLGREVVGYEGTAEERHGAKQLEEVGTDDTGVDPFRRSRCPSACRA